MRQARSWSAHLVMRTLSTDRGPGESILFVIVTKMVWTLYMVYMPRLLDADARHSCLQCCSRQQTVGWAGLGWAGLGWAHRNWSHPGASASTSRSSQHTVHTRR